MIGSLIGGGLKTGAAIAGGITGAKSAAKQQRMLNQQKMQNQRWYDQRYNEDSTQRADAQAALTNMRNAMAERSQASAGAAAVMGGTNEQAAAEKAAENSALGQTTQQIVVNGENRKDSIENQYQTRDQQLSQEQLNTERQKAQNMQNAASQMAQAGSDMAGANNKII